MDTTNIIKANKRRAKHGKHKTKTYSVWRSMKNRCKPDGHERYGQRGIRVCDRWQSFENFLEDMGEQPAGMTLDRIDNDGDYTPENCQWATRKQQSNNTSSNRMVTIKGETKTLAEWARHVGISYAAMKNRLNNGWDDDMLLNPNNLKGHTKKYVIEHEGECLSVKEYAERTGIPLATAYYRINK